MIDTDDLEQENKLGRPRAADSPDISFDEIDRLLVHGELVPTADGTATTIDYPSYRDLARRYKVSHTLIAKYSKDHDCIARRKQAQKKVAQMADDKLSKFRADTIAITRDDNLRIIDRFLLKFEEALDEGKVRCNNAADYINMLKLKAQIVGEIESQKNMTNGLPTLEEIQERHAEMLKAWEELTPEERRRSYSDLATGWPIIPPADYDSIEQDELSEEDFYEEME